MVSKVDFIKSLLDEKSKICMFVIFNYGIFNRIFNLSGLRTKLLYLTSWREVLIVAKKILTSNSYNKVKAFSKILGLKIRDFSSWRMNVVRIYFFNHP